MALQISWTFYVEKPNSTFDTTGLLIAKAMIEHYFDIKMPQTNAGMWKIFLSARTTSTPNAYAFTNGWNTYFSSTRNYNKDILSICAAARHEIGHTPTAPGNVRTRHNSEKNALMYYALNPRTMWTPNDCNYWFKLWSIKNRGCFIPPEINRWFPGVLSPATADTVQPTWCIDHPTPPETLEMCGKRSYKQMLEDSTLSYVEPTHIPEEEFNEELKKLGLT